MTDLHSKIMNIQINTQRVDSAIDECCRESCFTEKDYSKVVRITSMAYRRGHRDARHAAAELALQVKELEGGMKKYEYMPIGILAGGGKVIKLIQGIGGVPI